MNVTEVKAGGSGSAVSKAAKAIEVRGITKVYPGDVRALDGLSLSVDPGKTYALLGPNGAGKTTTVSILTTLTRPSDGMAQVDGIDVVANADAARRKIGVTFQEMILDDALTGLQVLSFHGRLYRLPRAECAARAAELLDLVELTEAGNRKCKTYSGGMKRRLELARALMTVPKVLFLDEPTLGLDPTGRAAIWDYIRQLVAERGLTVFLTTHYLDEAQQLADTVGILDHGRLVAEGRPAALIDELGEDTVTLRGTGRLGDTRERLSSLEFVKTVTPLDGGLMIGLESSSRHLPEIIAEATATGFAIEDVGVAKPDLGSVFAKYTGHRLVAETEENQPSAEEEQS